MKKIFITGGSSGIGLEITKQFSDFEITNFSRSTKCDITDNSVIEKIIKKITNEKPKYLFLNAGLGQTGPVGTINDKLIESVFKINTIANIKIINGIIDLIKKDEVKVIVTLSTASYINGAFESVYNASKKAIKEFIVSTNTELKDFGSNNYIFEFIPHYIAGTKMTGGNLDGSILANMIKNLRSSIQNNENKYVPKYEEIYKKVFENYKNNPIEQGIQSINYKREKGKI